MKTDDFVIALAREAGPALQNVGAKRFSLAVAIGMLASILLMLATLGSRPDLAAALAMPKFWMKVAFAGAMAVAGYFAMARLGRPGVRPGLMPVWIALPVVLIWLVIAFVLFSAAPAERLHLLLGQTWMVCPFLIAMLSAPFLVTAFWAMQGLAPTRLNIAGAATGLFAGALGALVYSLHCAEMEAPFIGTWYLLGILIPTGIGALAGRVLLRW
jgi:hypothetical protein